MATVNSGPTSTDGSEQEHLECGGGAKTNAFTRRDTVHQVRTQHASSVIILKISRKPCMLSQENRAISLQISIDTGSADSVVCSVDSFSGSWHASTYVLKWSKSTKCLHQLAAPYLESMISPISALSTRRHLRSSGQGDLVVPKTRTAGFGPRSFSVAGPSLWSTLPSDMKQSSLSIAKFCIQLKSVMFVLYARAQPS